MTPPVPNRMAEARAESIRLARERLCAGSLPDAATRLELPIEADGSATIDVLGKPHKVTPEGFHVKTLEGKPAHAVDEFLILRYLECPREVRPTGEAISFRDLPGGSFYFEPMSNRSSKIILKAFGNDTERLRTALTRYPADPVEQGDLGVAIHAIGRIDVSLIYRTGDDEFPASLDILYDKVVTTVFTTDEVAALTTRLCVGLLVPVR